MQSDPDACRDALSRLLRSHAFAKASRLSKFLEYVCQLALQGRESEINELNLGTNLFERPTSYNPSEDTIVRTTARLLRQRLQSYYETEGTQDPVRVSIARGAYVPAFTTAPSMARWSDKTPPSRTKSASAVQPLEQSPSRQRRWPILLMGLLAGATLAVAAMLAVQHIHLFRSPSERFWAILFPRERDTLVVPADTTLLMYESATHTKVSLDSYISGDFVKIEPRTNDTVRTILNGYRGKRYTAVTSVALGAELGKLPKMAPERMQVRFARDLQLNDLKRSNAILIGAVQNNPWGELFHDQLNFHIDWDASNDKFLILNDHPINGESSSWTWMRDDPQHRGYGQIALVKNLSGNGYVLLIPGTSMAGTQAAMEFLLDPTRFNPILKQALRSDGTVASFEILLQANLIGNGNSMGSKVLGVRIHP